MKLEVKKFGPIANSSFDIKKLNLFIGESATGKSIVVKLIYLCNTFAERFALSETTQKLTLDDFKAALVYALADSFEDVFGAGYQDFEFTYFYSDNEFLEVISDEKEFQAIFSPQLDSAFDKFFASWHADIQEHAAQSDATDIPSIIYRHQLRQQIKYIFSKESYVYIPAGRGFFTLLSENVFSIIESGVGIDLILARFGMRFTSSRQRHTTDDSAFDGLSDGSLQERFRVLMKGSYRFEHDEDRFYLAEDHFLPLNQISSGQQELLPALIVLLDTLRSKTPVSIIFEEPEAHLFPKDQKRLIELLIYMLNLSENKNKLFVTTHSPYLLSSVNNMIYAGRLNSGQMEKQLHLNFSDTAAYALADGRASSILNMDNQLIDAAYIDSVSGDIAGLFDKLLDEEYGDD